MLLDTVLNDRKFGIEISGVAGSGKSALLQTISEKLQARGSLVHFVDGRAKAKLPPLENVSYVLVDNWEDLTLRQRSRILRHPRYVIASDTVPVSLATERIALDPPATDLGYILNILRKEIRGEKVPLNEQSYLENAVRYWFERPTPSGVPKVKSREEAEATASKISIKGRKPAVLYECMATRIDVADIYFAPYDKDAT